MGTLLRHVGHERGSPTRAPRVKRAVAVLSDGSAVYMVCDPNQTGVSGDGGDNTGVAKLYFYHTVDRTTFTLKNTMSIGAKDKYIQASMCVDVANNIHVAWRGTDGSLDYRRLAFSAGPTWSAGSQEAVSGVPGGNSDFEGVDIDVLGTSTTHVVVAGHYNTTAGTRSVQVRTYVRRTDGVWDGQTIQTVINGDEMKYYANDMSVAADQQAIGGDNIALYAVHVVRAGQVKNKDHGDVVYMFKTNISTGATVSLEHAAGAFNAGQGTSAQRKYWLWSSGPDKWVLGGVSGNSPWQTTVFAFTWNRTTNTRTSLDIPVVRGGQGTVLVPRYNHNWFSAAYNKVNQTVTVFAFNASYSYSLTIRLDFVNHTAYTQSSTTRWDNDFRYAGVVGPDSIWGGSQSRNTSAVADTVINFWLRSSTKAYRTYGRGLGLMLAPGAVLPANLALVATDRPVLSLDHKNTQRWPQQLHRGEWQLATDAAFTVNQRMVTEPISDSIHTSDTTPPYNVKRTSTELVTAIGELFSGTWFIRARSLGYNGQVGPWSPAQSFVVLHPPVPANLSPTGGQIVVLAPSNLVTLTWDFTDPSQFDSQTAYQILVEDNETEIGIVDTDKVVSIADQASVMIPEINKNTSLRWRVKLWDSDDIDGPFSDNHLFYATDPPVPDILSPADASTIVDGTPIISWDPGVTGDQLQTSYRILVTQGALIVHDSHWLFGDETLYQIPLGVLHDANSYTVTLQIRDNFGLDGTDSVSFTTAWIPPVSPTGLQVYLAEYAKRGFVYLVQDIDEIDEDFIQYNLYRRKYGEAEWTQVTVWQDAIQTPLVYRDYLIGSGETYQYTVTQVVDNFGDIMESAITAEEVYDMVPISDGYWLFDTVEIETDSLPLYAVTSEPFTEEFEQETYHVIGRGRHTDFGDRLGYAGSMSCQLRDRVQTGIETTNYSLNPAMQIYTAGSVVPDRWDIVESGGPIDDIGGTGHTGDPSPTGKILVPEVFVIDMPNSAIIQLQQQLELAELPLAIVGQTVTFSVWCYDAIPMGSGTQWRLDLAVLDVADSVLASSGSHTLAHFEEYTTSGFGSPDYQNPSGPVTGIWKRFMVTVLWPAGSPAKLRYAVGARNNTGGLLTNGFKVTGAQVEIGPVTPYTDGDQLGSMWLGEPGLAPSHSTGFYTGRQQRLNLEEMRNRKRSVFVRTPFGDIFRVSTGNISVNRIPGTGRTEFTDIEIPYSEVYE